MAARSTKQPHVRFASGLTVPPAHRQRKVENNLAVARLALKLTRAGQSHSFYPKVAQEKGHSERKSSFDLFWQWGKLSSIPHNQNKRQYSQPKRLAAEVCLATL